MESTQIRKDLKHNLIANLGDGGFFGFATGLASFTTIIPLFVANMTNSATLIGLIPAIHNMGWQLPQLLTAKRLTRMERVKPFVIVMTIQERLPILVLAILALLQPRIGKIAALIATFAILVWQGLGAGFNANGWQILISRVIPTELRATFFGAQSAVSNLLASIGAIFAGVMLEHIAPPWDFASCFLAASFLYIVSWLFLRTTREPTRLISPDQVLLTPLWHDVIHILKTDVPFRNYLISRFISQFGLMASAFYTVFAVTKLGMNTVAVGIMTSILMITQVVANPLLGRLADKWSRKGVLILGSIAAALSALLALWIKDPNLFALVFILTGIGAAAFWTIGLAISLEFGSEAKRPTYVGMSNTLVAPSAILAPLLGGFLADAFTYSITFIASAFFGFLSVITLAFLVKEPAKGTLPSE